jgi:sugar/nucleoside kinase (ribokinase family)
LGLSAGFIGQVGSDQLGEIFSNDIRGLGVEFETPARSDVGSTGRCLILVTPDAQRTMNTCLGAAQRLDASSVDPKRIGEAKILYLEGYLWDPEGPRAAMHAAIDAARDADTKVAFTLSDSFVVGRHRDDLLALVEAARIDIMFANEDEILQLAGAGDLQAALDSLSAKLPTLVVTRSEKGAVATSGGQQAEVPAEPIERLVDTTGAGDLFAAGFLAGQARGLGLERSLKLGAVTAAEVIQHYGARPEADLKELVAELLPVA